MSQRGRHLGNRPLYDSFHQEFVDPNRFWQSRFAAPGFQSSRPNDIRPQHYPPPHAHGSSAPPHPSTPSLLSNRRESVSYDNEAIFSMITELRNAWAELKGENLMLRQTVNLQAQQIATLDKQLDELNRYGRCENVCFTNLLIDNDHTAETQVIGLCNELGVEVTPDDLVASHTLPARKGKAVRVIARFKERSMAQEVFAKRKETKNIPADKKKGLAAKADKGFAIQPNITPKRAKLLAQVKDAVQNMHWNSVWVDYRNGNIMLKQNPASRPIQIHSTRDLKQLVGPNFNPLEYYFCVRETCDFNVNVTPAKSVFSPVEPSTDNS